MTTFRDAIKDDFKNVCDDLETVTVYSRQDPTPRLVAVCRHAKRSVSHDLKEAVDSLGFAVADFVTFRIASSDLPLTDTQRPGDWLVDERGDRYAFVSMMDSKMTAGVRIKTVSLQQVLDQTVTILGRGGVGEAGGPGARDVVLYTNVRARVWAIEQTDADYLGEDLRPRWRAALFADGQQVMLPLPQGVSIQTPNGDVYNVTAVHGLDALAGFAVLDLTSQPPTGGA